MGKALWDEELDMVIFCQFYSHMFAVSRGALANIYCYIEHSTFYAANQLALGIRRALEVQASHDTIAAHRLVVLAEVYTVSQNWGNLFFKLSLAEALEEVATSDTEEAWLYNEDAINFCFYYIHWFIFCSLKKEFLKSSQPSLALKKEFFRKSPRPSLPLKKEFFESLRLPLAKGSSTSNQAFLLRRKDVTALRCSEPLRSKVGGPSKVFARLCGMGPPGAMTLLLNISIH